MDVHIKRAVKAGNSSAVILPRSWLHKEVRIELVQKTNGIILAEVLETLKKNLDLGEVIGIYLVGSYARGEEDEKSDIDVLVITQHINKETIYEGIYTIMIISEKTLKLKLEEDILPIAPMLQEAKSLLNAAYISSINVSLTQKNIRDYLQTTAEKLSLIGRVLRHTEKKKEGHLPDRIAYTLILRIRTLYIIAQMIKQKRYTKKEFIRHVQTISKNKTPYERYRAVKNNEKEKKMLTLTEARLLHTHLKDQLENLKKLVRTLPLH